MVADGRDGPECQNGGREVREGGGGTGPATGEPRRRAEAAASRSEQGENNTGAAVWPRYSLGRRSPKSVLHRVTKSGCFKYMNGLLDALPKASDLELRINVLDKETNSIPSNLRRARAAPQ